MNKRISAVLIGMIVFLLIASFGVNTGNVSSQRLDNNRKAKSLNTDELAELTIEIASLGTKHRTKNLSESKQIRDSIVELAEKRHEKLSELIKDSPADVLRFALPEDVLNNLPEEIQKFLEKRGEAEGELEVISECEENNGRILYYINIGKERFSLHFSKLPEEELLTGTKVKVKGVHIGDGIVVEENGLQNNSKDFAALESALPNTTGEIKVLVLLVNFQNDSRQPYTISQANNLMFNNANSSSVTNYYREASYGQTWISGDTYGWFTLPMSADCEQTSQIATLAKEAATNAGVNLSAYNKFMYIFPQISCSYSGRANVGGQNSWINGSLVLRTTAHELGHNLGLRHSKALDCGSEIISSSCTTVEYGHPGDIIGATGMTGHFHPYQKERLGWINYTGLPPVTTVQSSGDYFIYANSVQDSNAKALKILKGTDSYGRKIWYYLEFRRAVGFDSYLSSYNGLLNGVIITMNNESNGSENYLLDMTPSTTSWTDSALLTNNSFTDTNIGLTITTRAVGSDGATVNISFNSEPPPCVLANPTVSVSPSDTQWFNAGGSVNYTVSGKNNNSSSCTENNFNLQMALPNGWWYSTSTPSISIAPGATGTVSLQVTSPGSAGSGFYTGAVTLANTSSSAYSASATLDMAIYSSLMVAVSTSQSSYTSNQVAVISAVVSANNSPMAGAKVTFTIKKPNGDTTTGTATTDSNGSASYSYRFNKKKDPPGTYLVTANANQNSVSGSGSTSFVLK